MVLSPEEWVRQNFAIFLAEEKGVPRGRIIVEKSLIYNTMQRRCDLLVYGNTDPVLIVECKSPDIKINQAVFDQVSVYNLEFKVAYLAVTNGLDHYCCQLDFESREIIFLKDIPTYREMLTLNKL